MFDKFKKRYRVSKIDSRLRRQIAGEAARRMLSNRNSAEPNAPSTDTLWLDASTEADFMAAKRKAVAVLGHRVRPNDLPTDDEVREQVLSLLKNSATPSYDSPAVEEAMVSASVVRMADHIDRFTLYKMKLVPLESVKQNPKVHPEGDALYHSLQVFEHAKGVHPYDEEFLLAALLHDIGKAIDPHNHVDAGVEALRGAVTERTLWLIEHHMDLCANPRYRKPVESGTEQLREDLKVLREMDEAGRIPGFPVSTIDEAIAYLKALDDEAFLDD